MTDNTPQQELRKEVERLHHVALDPLFGVIDIREQDAQKLLSAMSAATAQLVTNAINSEVRSALDSLEASLDDGKQSHSMAVIRAAIEEVKRKYE